jgi:hypothetical protein
MRGNNIPGMLVVVRVVPVELVLVLLGVVEAR